MFINGFASIKPFIYFLPAFWQLKFSTPALWGQRFPEAGAVPFCVSAAECPFSLGLSRAPIHRSFFHFTDPGDLTSGQQFTVSMPL